MKRKMIILDFSFSVFLLFKSHGTYNFDPFLIIFHVLGIYNVYVYHKYNFVYITKFETNISIHAISELY